MFAPILSQQGLFGNAWQMPSNVVANGGEFVYNFFDIEGNQLSKTKATKAEIINQIAKQKHNANQLQNYSAVEGDVIGLFNPSSDNHLKAYKQNKKAGYNAYNTHVGFIRYIDNIPVVEHNVHGNIVRTPLSDILQNNSSFKIASIARPKYLLGTPIFINSDSKTVYLLENIQERN